jgi:tetratricopeptide (TPR) repeat protein
MRSIIFYIVLGNVYTATEQPAKAIEAYQQAVRIDPKYAKAWNRLGLAYENSKQYGKAIEAYQQAVRIDPEFAVAWYNLGRAYNETKLYAKANDAFQQAVRIDPKDAEAWVELAVSYGRTNQTEKAIESFQQATRIKPEIAHAWFLFGLSYGKSYQPDKTFENYNQEISIAVETALTTQEREGMVGLQIEVADCYKKQKNESYCFYLDIASRQYDQIVSEGMRYHHVEFFTEEKVRARIEPGFTKLKMDKNTANKYIAEASLEIKGLLVERMLDKKQ